MITFLIFFLQLVCLLILSRILTKELSRFFFKITKNKSATVYFLALLFLPGTIIHELAHLITAGVLFVPVGQLELVPQIEGERVKMGSVAIGKTDPVRRFLIGVAPFIIGLSLLSFTFWYAQGYENLLSHWMGLIIVYVAFEISNTMFSSRRDMEGAIELLAALIVVWAILFFAGVRIPAIDTSPVLLVVEQGSEMLWYVLGIDVGIVALAKLLNR